MGKRNLGRLTQQGCEAWFAFKQQCAGVIDVKAKSELRLSYEARQVGGRLVLCVPPGATVKLVVNNGHTHSTLCASMKTARVKTEAFVDWPRGSLLIKSESGRVFSLWYEGEDNPIAAEEPVV